MGRKSLVRNFKSIDAGDMSQASIIGEASDVSQFDSITYEVFWSGGQTLNGKVEVEYSRDEGKTFKTLPLDGAPSVDGASGSHLIIINEIGFTHLRPKYTRQDPAATGSLTVGIFQTVKGA